jgi:teichuronic acid biosynthesis glycosyltransferase TuaG
LSELVSIIVPVYNAAPYIEKTIEMVCEQTWPNWEMVLVDDASTDDTAERIERMIGAPEPLIVGDYPGEEGDSPQSYEDIRGGSGLHSQIRLYRCMKNAGPAHARNLGVRKARGRYIAFLDADDVWKPEKLEKELAFMKEKKAAFVYCSYEFGDRDARGTGSVVHALPELTYRQALTRTIIFTTTVLFDMTKLTPDDIKMPDIESEDTATWWKILRSGVTAYGLDEVLAVYRRPEKSLSSNKGKAVARIWNLYRREEHLGLLRSACCLAGWAVRASARRL